MYISGFGISSREYDTGYGRKKEKASEMAFSGLPEEGEEENARRQDALPEKEGMEEEGSDTQTRIVVKPDGSRVLMVMTRVGGMEATMSLKISDGESMLHNGDGLYKEGALHDADVLHGESILHDADVLHGESM